MRSFPASPTSSDPESVLDGLTERQSQCLVLAATGLTSGDIAERLDLSSRTVDEHLTGACRTLGVRTRIQAVARLAASQRIVEPRSFLP